MARRARAASLPTPLSSFIGREEELPRVNEALLSDGVRLLTLVGLGGTGKTRLAVEAARALASDGRFEGGVHFCDLSHARAEDDVCRAVAAALGIALERGRGAASLLARALAGYPPLLLVLDNFEQIVSAAPATAGAWLDAAPSLSLLVTSREPLRLRGETVLEVPPLPTSRAGARQSDAAELFSDRARAHRPAAADPEVVDAIVGALDGLPLAIELAAARLSVLSPAELLELLPRRFELLTRGARDLPERQSSLERALDWSWECLGEDERQAFARCAVFHGAFDRDAARAVLGPSDGDALRALDLLQSLRDKSLLITAQPAPDGSTRFGMLFTVRAYAELRLRSSGQYDEARRRHAGHYLARARAAAAELAGAKSREALGAITAELDDLATIVDAAPEGPEQAALALEALVALEPLFDLRGPTFDALRRLDTAIEAALLSPPSDPALLPEARRVRAKVRRMHGMLVPAAEDAQAALSAARARADRPAEARALVDTCWVHRAAGRMPEVERTARATIALLEELDGPLALTGLARMLLAVGVHSQGRLTEAPELYRRALEDLTRAGDRRVQGMMLGSLGFLHEDLDEMDEAERTYHLALALHRELDNRRSEGVILGYLGNVQRRRGERASAEKFYAEAIALSREQGDEQFEGVFHMDWGILLSGHGCDEEARAHFEEALDHLARAGDERCAALVFGHLGGVHASALRVVEAERCFAEAEVRLKACGDPHFAKVVEVLGGQLDVARARASREAGRADAATESLERARRALADADRMERPSGHMVLARARLQHAIERAEPPADALVIGPEAAWFRPPGATDVDLAGRPPLRGILTALAEARARAPGEAVRLAALFAAGWPGERIQREAMHNRVRVALSTLRKMGLAAAIDRTDDGWLLDPKIRMVRAG